MSVGSVTSSNGIFTIVDSSGKAQQVDLGTLMMMLNLDRTENLDAQIAIQLEEIQDRNKMIEDLTAFMSACRSRKASEGSFSFGANDKAPSGTLYSTLWNQYVGGTWSSSTGKADEKSAAWEANINAIKGKIDTLNNDSQVDNIKLQNLLEKRGNAFEMATQTLDTNNQSVQSTLRNL